MSYPQGCCFGSLTPNTILVAGGTPARPIIKLADMNDVADPSSAGAALVRAGCPGHLAPEALTFGLSGLGCDPRVGPPSLCLAPSLRWLMLALSAVRI